MNDKKNGFVRRYESAFRKHMKLGAVADLLPALALGREAVVLGLETLGLAKIHEQAMAALAVPGLTNGHRKQAEAFFTEAIIPIVETHWAAREGRAELKRVNDSLGRRTAELLTSNRLLAKGVARRKVMEVALVESGKNHKKYLEESLELQKRLRLLTHRVLAHQEDERTSISRELQHEIAQTLLGINVRLLSLKQEARNNGKGLKDEIAGTQRLVAKSARSVRRVAHKLGGL